MKTAYQRWSFNPTLVRLRRTRNFCGGLIPACFNPTLVRLRRLSHARRWSMKVSSFNPTLVRLRPFMPWPAMGRAMWFQSHAGSIEACW